MIGKALIVASPNGLEKIVEALLERGANDNDRSILGGSALHVACLHGHERVVRVLLARGGLILIHKTDTAILSKMLAQGGMRT